MPTYNYKCSKCEHEFEKIKRIADRFWNEPCPNCGANEESIALVPVSPRLVTSVGSIYSKTDGAFKDNLERMKKHHPRNTIKT